MNHNSVNDNTINRFVNMIRNISDQSNKPDTMIFGVVKEVKPLQIDIGNDIILTEDFLFLGQMCRPHKVTIPHTHLIDAFLTEKSKAINTKSIISGVATNIPQNTASYDVKTQKIERNEDEGTNERELKTETKSKVDLGGATLEMSVDVSTSPVSTSEGSGTVTSTIDFSSLSVDDKSHKHIITEKETQDVHFPGTLYEDSVEMEIYPRLKIGDKVLMFAFNNYQMYYVAERIENEEE